MHWHSSVVGVRSGSSGTWGSVFHVLRIGGRLKSLLILYDANRGATNRARERSGSEQNDRSTLSSIHGTYPAHRFVFRSAQMFWPQIGYFSFWSAQNLVSQFTSAADSLDAAADWAAWLPGTCPGGSVGPQTRWAAPSTVEGRVGQRMGALDRDGWFYLDKLFAVPSYAIAHGAGPPS